jgi:glycosyltransferase involved in cell wall biosynthesis
MERILTQVVKDADVVHVHMPFIYPTLAGERAARRQGIPVFYHQHGVFDPVRLKFKGLKKAIYLKWIERPVLRRCQTLLALTEAERDSYRIQAPQVHCELLPNGVHVGQFKNRSSSGPRATRERLKIPGDAFVILFMARIHPIKGIEFLCEAFAQVATQRPDAWLVVAGPDEWHLVPRCRHLAGAATDRLVTPGMVTGDEKLDLLASADLFCLPSSAEGFSMSVLEAMASACPVLLSPGCHFPRATEAGAAIVCEPVANDLARAILSLADNKAALKAMGLKGQTLVESEFDWERIIDHLLVIYGRTLNLTSNEKSGHVR